MIRKFVNRNEKGAVIVFFAITLPLFLMLVGGAIDFGNAYIHKSRLQNTADAAALAGARVYAINGEKATVGGHPLADEEARRYVEKDASGEGATLRNVVTNVNETSAYQAKANASGSVVYYRVLLKETVPFYFLRILGDNFKSVDIKADAVAAISATTGNGKDLFLFRHKLKIVNSIDSPDNFDLANKIRVTFDGNIAFTDGGGANPDNASNFSYDDLEYSTQTRELKYFFTAKAKEEGLSINEAIKKGEEYAFPRIFENYDMDLLGKTVKEKMKLPDYKERTKENWDNYHTLFKTKGDLGTIESSDLENNLAITADIGNGDGNIDVSIGSKIQGSTSDPIYVYFDESIYMINVNVNASNERPLVLVYTGTGKLHINFSSGSTFSGVIYAPNVPDYDNCLINNNGGSFEGTIIANYLDIQGGQGAYRYKDFGISGTGGSGGSGQVTASSSVKLSEPDDITWD
ncbi:MAG: pilus assembly protein [Selenomonadaceae bacterium]|nr:pilus assembly protein [Selenomonadaceae bacterium]